MHESNKVRTIECQLIEKTIFALNSETRRRILRELVGGPMNLKGVFRRLLETGSGVKYPESVYKGLELLVDAGLVEKLYDRERGLLYKLTLQAIIIDFSKL